MTKYVYLCRGCERIVDIRVVDDKEDDEEVIYAECEDYPNCC